MVGTHWECYRYLGRLPRGGGIFDLNFEGRCRSLNPRRNYYDRAVTGTVAILVFSCHSSGTLEKIRNLSWSHPFSVYSPESNKWK